MTTGQQIWDLALDYFDDAAEAFADTTFEVRYVNIALSEIHEMLANSKNSDYFRSEQSVTLVAGTESYALSSDFYKAMGVFYVTGSGSTERLFPIPKWHPQQIGGYRSSPISGGTIRIWYYPYYTELSALSETINALYIAGWEDYAALQVASRLAMKERDGEKYQILAKERDRKRALILDALSPRDDFQPDSIADVTGRFTHPLRGLVGQEERWLMYRIQGSSLYVRENEFRGV